MRKLIGSLVAEAGAEPMAARTAVGFHLQFQCKHSCGQFLYEDVAADRVHAAIVHAAIDEEEMGADTRAGRPITIVYAREVFTNDAVEGTASAVLPGRSAFV